MWASLKVQEFSYRKLFHLSKKDMLDEPMEDVTINLKIQQFIHKKQETENAIMEKKAKMSSSK